ncbi:MAG: SRPBCC family protein [Chthoniobacter sp.]|uniref:SRPBCC family protein n=1 Tax=Chthoniobacter sp. TaxID=2510640 RepID=UPI0032A6BE6F
MEKPKFVYVTHINTTPEKLWDALTNPDFTQQYWGGRRVQSDWTVGASIKHLKADGAVELRGEVLQAEPPRLLSYTFLTAAGDRVPDEKATRVTFEITTAFGVTKLTIVHDGFEPDSKLIFEISNGWQAILSSLKTLLETGAPLPFNYKC